MLRSLPQIVLAPSTTQTTVLGREAMLERACELIIDAGQSGAQLIIFPDDFASGVPDWMWQLPPTDDLTREIRDRIIQLCVVRVPSTLTERLCRIAHRAAIDVMIGVVECEDTPPESNLYHTVLYIDASGTIRRRYRTALALAWERLGATPVDMITTTGEALSSTTVTATSVGGI